MKILQQLHMLLDPCRNAYTLFVGIYTLIQVPCHLWSNQVRVITDLFLLHLIILNPTEIGENRPSKRQRKACNEYHYER